MQILVRFVVLTSLSEAKRWFKVGKLMLKKRFGFVFMLTFSHLSVFFHQNFKPGYEICMRA
ncbi:hypothetical protein T4E_625 [Trichinella pseudospiralis]|uniref:Uncharacterized protein n=1 Tax=Trichinella pseudospiralis TaxID=6337 RepID=A0A0V0XZM4_TRIPS|nr:hypothetical protein T4E_625 [Trichinella pseudospiralis]